MIKDGSRLTGNLRLSQAGYTVDGVSIEQTTYFRDTVFGQCDWETTEKGGKTQINVEVVIDSEIKGEYDLKVTHELHRETNQDNVTTILHWKNAMPVLEENNITG